MWKNEKIKEECLAVLKEAGEAGKVGVGLWFTASLLPHGAGVAWEDYEYESVPCCSVGHIAHSLGLSYESIVDGKICGVTGLTPLEVRGIQKLNDGGHMLGDKAQGNWEAVYKVLSEIPAGVTE